MKASKSKRKYSNKSIAKCLELFAHDCLNYKQISDLTGLPYGTISTWVIKHYYGVSTGELLTFKSKV